LNHPVIVEFNFCIFLLTCITLEYLHTRKTAKSSTEIKEVKVPTAYVRSKNVENLKTPCVTRREWNVKA